MQKISVSEKFPFDDCAIPTNLGGNELLTRTDTPL